MKFRETTQEDVDFVADHSISRGVEKHRPERVDFCYTLEHEGRPLVIGGFRLINATTAWGWVDITDAAGGRIISVYRAIKEWTDTFTKTHKIRRLQAYVEKDFTEGIRMLQHLGFEKESAMLNFVGDKDAFMYVRII